MPPTTVHIPRPCSVNWDTLTPTTTGYHCANCQTEVIDFTRLTQAEILDSLAAQKGQRVCAVLTTPMVFTHPKRPRGSRRWLLAMALLCWQPASTLPLKYECQEFISKKAVRQKQDLTITGTVIGTNDHRPVQGATVLLEDTEIGTSVEENGNFRLIIPVTHLRKKLTLLVSFVGYDTKQVKIKQQAAEYQYSLQISLKPTHFID